MPALSHRARLNLQRRLYEVWSSRLIEAVELGERSGPSEKLTDILELVLDAEVALRTAIAAAR